MSLAVRVAREAEHKAYRVIEAEMNGEVTYVSASTVRMLTPLKRWGRILTQAIDLLDAERSLCRVYEAPKCKHGVSLRASFGCVECAG